MAGAASAGRECESVGNSSCCPMRLSEKNQIHEFCEKTIESATRRVNAELLVSVLSASHTP